MGTRERHACLKLLLALGVAVKLMSSARFMVCEARKSRC